MIDDPPKFWDGDYGCYLVYESDYDALRAERDRLAKLVESMQHVVNCASVLRGTDDDESTDSEDDRDAMLELFDAVDAYRAALAPKDTGGTK